MWEAFGPTISTAGGGCQSGNTPANACTFGTGVHALGFLPIFFIPLVGAVLIAVGAWVQSRRLLVAGDALVWIVALLGIASIGLLLMPGAVLALIAALAWHRAATPLSQ